MWFPKKEFKVIKEALTLEDIKSVLEEKFPEYSISIEEKEDQKFIQVDKSFFVGLAVNLTPRGVGGRSQIEVKPYREYRSYYKNTFSFTPYFCYSKHVNEIGNFLEARLGEKIGDPGPVPPSRWNLLNFLICFFIPAVTAFYLLYAILYPHQVPYHSTWKTPWLATASGLLGGMAFLYLSCKIDDLPERWQIPVIFPILAGLSYIIGLVASLIGLLLLIFVVRYALFPKN